MNRIEKMFLALSLILTIFLHIHYMSGLYYDQDVAFYVNSTLEILRGRSWYSSFGSWGNKPPGINFIFLLAFYIFGESFISIQIFSLIAKILSVILLYLLAKRLLTRGTRFYLLLPLLYALFSSSEVIQAHTSNLETFLSPFEIAGIIFLGLAEQNKKDIFYFFSGFVLGLGFLIKQSALATCFAGLLFIFACKIIHKENFTVFFKKVFFFTFLFLIPLMLFLGYSIYFGAWRRFIENVFIINMVYFKNVSILRNIYMPWSMQQLWRGLRIEIVIFGMLTSVGIFYSLKRYKQSGRLLALFWFVITTLVISVSGFHLRHHFIEILAPILTLSVIGVSDSYNLCVSIYQKKRFFSKMFLAIGIAILVFPYFHIIAPLVKEHKLQKSFLLTQKYLYGSDKDKYARLILHESYDAGRRFLISQYVKERTNKNDKIFVWDGLDVGSLYLWTQRDGFVTCTKFFFLPAKMRGPYKIYAGRDLSNYRLGQSQLLTRLYQEPPEYIIIVQSVAPMPSPTYSHKQVLFEERKEFSKFFDFINTRYHLEKVINDCFAYRLD